MPVCSRFTATGQLRTTVIGRISVLSKRVFTRNFWRIRSHIIRIAQNISKGRLKEKVRHAFFESIALGLDVHRHQLVLVKVVKFLSVGAPQRLLATVGRNPPFAAGPAESSGRRSPACPTLRNRRRPTSRSERHAFPARRRARRSP